VPIEDNIGSRVAVRARGITKCFDNVVALDGVDLDVVAGQIHGLVGPNGAGKTTLLGLLLGLAVADRGSLEILGMPVGRALAVPDGVAGFVDGPGLYPSLTARGNLAALAALRGPGAPTAGIDDLLEQVGLTDVADDRVRGFSLGVHGVLTQLAADGATVVLSSHRMDDLAALCSEVTIVATGRVVFSGPLSKLAAGNSALDYRLLTSDPEAARRVAADTAGVQVVDDAGIRPDLEVLVVRALVPALDELVPRLIHSGIAVRELAPVVSPLESAFLALTEQQESGQ